MSDLHLPPGWFLADVRRASDRVAAWNREEAERRAEAAKARLADELRAIYGEPKS